MCPSGSAEGSIAAGAERGKGRSFLPRVLLAPSCMKQPWSQLLLLLTAAIPLLAGRGEQAGPIQYASAAGEQAVWHREDRDPL